VTDRWTDRWTDRHFLPTQAQTPPSLCTLRSGGIIIESILMNIVKAEPLFGGPSEKIVP